MDYIPDDFFQLITPASPLQSIKNLFGEPKKFYSKEKEQSNYHIYFYDMKNCYLLISSIDNLSVSSICIQSKGIPPFVKVGSKCPLNIKDNPVLLGKTSFNTLKLENTDKRELEVGRDRCTEFLVLSNYLGRPCEYYSFSFGSFIPYGSINTDELTENNKVFEYSLGVGIVSIPKTSLIDYVVIGDENAIKQTHHYGEGVHCDYF